MDVENNTIRKSCVAGIYASCSDAVAKHLGASKSFLGPYLIHNLNPVKAGIAGFVISCTAEKCHSFVLSWLPKSYQDSSLIHISTRIFAHLVVGGALGAGSALLLPAAGITATAGVALGFATFIGTSIDHGIAQIISVEYFNKLHPTLSPSSGKDTVTNALTASLYIPFSDAITKYFVDPHSILERLLVPQFQSLVGGLLLGLSISFFSNIAYEIFSRDYVGSAFYDSKLTQFLIWTICHIATGAFVGLTLSCIPTLGFTIANGVSLGIASFVGPMIIRTACKALRVFYRQTALHLYLQDYNTFNQDFLLTIKKEGNASHQARFFLKCLKKSFYEPFRLIRDYTTNRMDEVEFKKWRGNNPDFWQSVCEGKLSTKLTSQIASDENLAGLYYALTETDLIPHIVTFKYKDQLTILSMRNKYYTFNNNVEYPYKYNYNNLKADIKKHPQLNAKILIAAGIFHWGCMDKSIKTKEFVKEMLLHDIRCLRGLPQTFIKQILPELMEDEGFLKTITYRNLLKIAAKANNIEEEALFKKLETFLLCLQKYKKTDNIKLPKPIQKMIIDLSNV